MAYGHGGARLGAGRKCDPQIAHLRTLIGTVMTGADWIKIINVIVDDVQSGDLRSVSFLLALRYGVTTQSLVAVEEADLQPAPAGTRPSPLCPVRRGFTAPREQHRGHRMRVADHAPAQYRRGGLSPQGRISTGRADESPSGTYCRGPASPPSAALGHKGIVASAAVRNPEGIAPTAPPTQPVIRDMRRSFPVPS